MRVRAAVLERPGAAFVVEDLTLDGPRAGEVLVRIAACGVCHSDYHVATGDTRHPMPCVTGHEGAGVVEAVGEGVASVRPGDSVVLSWAPDCGRCFYCLRGKPNLCGEFTGPLWDGVLLDGRTRLFRNGAPVFHYCGLAAFAERTVVPEACCIRVSSDVPPRVAALIGCAVSTGVGAVTQTVAVRPGDSVAVFGCGGVGLNIVQGAALAGAGSIIAVDKNPAKMELARRFGATHGVNANEDPVAAIRKGTGGRGADWVFEAIGAPKVQEIALDAARPGGVLVLVGLAPMGTATNFPSAVLARQEKSVVGSYYGSVHPRRDFPRLLDWYRAGRLKLDELVTHEYRLDQINEAFAAMTSGDAARGVIVL
jgi:NDMA-dependent alcohol dehydrogenase